MPLPFELPPARVLHRQGGGASLTLELTYEDRFLRRKRLVTREGPALVVDLEAAVSLDDGDVLECGDGTRVVVRAAAEPLLAVTGDLARLAWHIGNRHTPCRIEAGRLLIKRDHVIRDMLERLGAGLAEVVEPFTPEGGAYGFGRTQPHAH
jgi:urease accessory protein